MALLNLVCLKCSSSHVAASLRKRNHFLKLYEHYSLVLCIRDSWLFHLYLGWPVCLSDMKLKTFFFSPISPSLLPHLHMVNWPSTFILISNGPSWAAYTGTLRATAPRPPRNQGFIWISCINQKYNHENWKFKSADGQASTFCSFCWKRWRGGTWLFWGSASSLILTELVSVSEPVVGTSASVQLAISWLKSSPSFSKDSHCVAFTVVRESSTWRLFLQPSQWFCEPQN